MNNIELRLTKNKTKAFYMNNMNKYFAILLLVLVVSSCQSKHEPTTRDILEASIPLICFNVKNIYIWEEKDYREYEVKRIPISRETSKLLAISESETPYVYYLYDMNGKKTSYFIGRNDIAINTDSVELGKYAKIDGVPISRKADLEVILNDLSGAYLIALYCEEIDEKGNYTIEKIAHVDDLIDDKWKLQYFNSKNREEKNFTLDFNKNGSSMFLNLIPEPDPMIEQERVLDSLINDIKQTLPDR